MELTLDRISKQFQNHIAVDGFSYTMSNGVYGLLGANGAGKTTLMRMICTVLNPTSGEILFDGTSISDMGARYCDILGYLPQNFGYYPDFSAHEFLLYMASLKGIQGRAAKHRVEELLQMVGLSDVSRQKIRSFSGGMKQRLGVAQAVLNDPKVLVLDEPTAGLDPKERIRFRNLISDLSQNKIVILSTHIVSDVEYIADQILMMKKGKLILAGSPSELTEQAAGIAWSLIVPEREVGRYEAQCCICNLRHLTDGVELRIVSRNQPAPAAVPVQTTLEDLYLFHFADELGSDLSRPAGGKEKNSQTEVNHHCLPAHVAQHHRAQLCVRFGPRLLPSRWHGSIRYGGNSCKAGNGSRARRTADCEAAERCAATVSHSLWKF